MIYLINLFLSSSESRSPVPVVVVMPIYANESQLTKALECAEGTLPRGTNIYVGDIVH